MWSTAPHDVAEVLHRAEVDGGAIVGLVHRLRDETKVKGNNTGTATRQS